MGTHIELRDFKKLLEENKQPGVVLGYWHTPQRQMLSIFDYHMPKRRGFGHDGQTDREGGWAVENHEAQYWEEAKVTTVKLDSGYVPYIGSNGEKGKDEFGRETGALVEEAYRGALAGIQVMIDSGTLRVSDDIRRLFERHGRNVT